MTNKKEKFSLIEMGIVVGILLLFGIGIAVRGATTPTTGIEATFGILSSTLTDTSAATTTPIITPVIVPTFPHTGFPDRGYNE